MKAVILAGGFARRLKPVTNNLPKCLLAVAGKTIIDNQVEALREAGVKKVIIITGFKARFLEQHLRATQPESELTFIENKKFLETGPAYGLWLARDHFDEDVIYLNGDLFCEKSLIKKVVESKLESGTALQRNVWDDEQVKVSSPNGLDVSAMGKKIQESDSLGEFVGATKLGRGFLKDLRRVLDEYVENEDINRFAADSLNDTIKSGQRMGVIDVTKLKAIEIDTTDDLKTARRMFTSISASKVKTAYNLVLAYLVRFLARLTPKQKNLWVFYGWHKNREREVFADNSKYLFLEASKDKSLKALWLGKDEKICKILRDGGYEAKPLGKFSTAWTAMRAKYSIIDALQEINSWKYSGGSRLVQLWHGKGMKKTGHDSPYSLQRYSRLLYPYLFTKYHRLLAGSEHTAKLMSSTFKEEKEKIMIEGLPRNDVLFKSIPGAEIDSDKELVGHLENFKSQQSKKVILYAPTFRPDGSNPLDQLDLERLSELLKRRNFHLILSLHPKFAKKLYQIPEDNEHIKVIDAGWDIYPSLKHFDLLITDYSSLYVDFLLLDKPILFYVYDLEKYEKEMGLHEDFRALTPGPHLKNLEELLESIEGPDEFAKKRLKIKQKLFKYSDGNSSERVLKKLKSAK